MNEQMIRLYEAAEKLKKTTGQTDVARLINESPQTVNNWETRGISRSGILSVSKVIGCDPIWLDTNEGSMTGDIPFTPANISPKLDEIEIPQYLKIRGSMGNGVLLRDQPGAIHSWRVTSEWLTRNVRHHTGIANLCIVTGFGPSMKGMFNPGDPLLVDRGVKVVEVDAVYFFRVGNEGFIKTLQRVPGVGLRAISANKEFETWTITPDMDFEVFAQVLKVWKSEDF